MKEKEVDRRRSSALYGLVGSNPTPGVTEQPHVPNPLRNDEVKDVIKSRHEDNVRKLKEREVKQFV